MTEILKIEQNKGTIEFKCQNHGEIKKQLKEYFEEESKYINLNNKINEKINDICPLHKRKYIKYCGKCKLKFCEKDKHNSIHELVEIEEIYSYKKLKLI